MLDSDDAAASVVYVAVMTFADEFPIPQRHGGIPGHPRLPQAQPRSDRELHPLRGHGDFPRLHNAMTGSTEWSKYQWRHWMTSPSAVGSSSPSRL